MDQQPHNHNVGVGGHRASASLSTSQTQSIHTTASSGERSSGTARSMQAIPVTSAGGSTESQTPDQGSPATTDAAEWESSKEQTHLPMLPLTPPERSSADLVYDTVNFIQQMMIPGGVEAANCFLSVTEHPPVTPESLAELDMPRIINNPKLRHDVNFDRELHFRPNLDGSKGRQKMKLAEDYWKALEGELFLFGFVHKNLADPEQAQNTTYWQDILGCGQKRLSKLFHAIRDILKTLVPDCDQKSIEERLDVDLIMQEVLNGVLDLVDLGNWLAKVIKNHCAPMRDELVDNMRAEINRGALTDKPLTLVNGIRELLNILEYMKLDVANHQIRHMRPLLIEDTVNFQRRYNAHRISMNKIDIGRSRAWLNREMEMMTTSTTTPTQLEALTSALLRGLVFESHFSSSYPPTFYLDIDRLRMLRSEMHAEIYITICKEVLVEMAGNQATEADLAEPSATLETCVTAILAGTYGRIGTNAEYIAAEIMRLVLLMERKDGQCDPDLMDRALRHLETDLRTESPTFKKHAQDLVDRLLPRLQASVEQHIRLPALHLQDRLVPPAPPSSQTNPFGFGAIWAPVIAQPSIDPEEDVIRRFTHIIVLHWQVWAQLVYTPLVDDDDSSDSDGSNTPPSSGHSSPTVPVAQAVYAPGRKWLPIGVTVTEVPSGIPTPAPSPSAEAQGQSVDEEDDGDKSVHSGSASNTSRST